MKIIIYTKTGCPWCVEALNWVQENKEALDKNEIEFEERDARVNAEYFEELRQISGQDKTPTLVSDGKVLLADASREEIDKYFREQELI